MDFSLHFGFAAISSSSVSLKKCWNSAKCESLDIPPVVRKRTTCCRTESSQSINFLSHSFPIRESRRKRTPTRAIAVHISRNHCNIYRSFHRVFPADSRRQPDLAVTQHRRKQGILQGSRRMIPSCQAVTGDADSSSTPAGDSEKYDSINNGAPPGMHASRQKVRPVATTGRPTSSYYPPEFEFLKEMERPDLTPLWWTLGGVALLLVTRTLIVDEVVRWFYWIQVAAKGSVQGLNFVLTIIAGFLSRLFPAHMLSLAKFADQFWMTTTTQYAMMVEILPLWEAAASLLLATTVIAIADVAVPDSEKPRVNKSLLPAGAIALGVVCGKVHPERMLLLVGILSGGTALRWQSKSLTSALTAATSAVFTLVACVDSLLFRVPLLIGYLGLAVWQKNKEEELLQKESGEGKKGKDKNEIVHLPFLLRVATLIWVAVAGRRWAYKSLLQWMAL